MHFVCLLVLFSFNFDKVESNIFNSLLTLIEGEQAPEKTLSPAGIIEHYGYPAETHYVTTKDGYILTVHRIPHGKNGPSASRPVVFVQHGFVSSSAIWIMNTPEKSLAYLLADDGYDVWIGNYRGNTYCRNHTTLDVSDSRFWDFSWEEWALLDLPAMLDYALATSGASKLYYVGHSMGASTVMALIATNTEYNDKINSIMALAPAVIVKHLTGPLSYLGPGLVMKLLKLVKHGELPIPDLGKITICNIPGLNYICAYGLSTIFGPDWSQYNYSRTDIYVRFIPSTTSVKLLEHLEQVIVSGKFCKFDYYSLNKQVYKQETPPEFDLSKVTIPVAIFYGDSDWLVRPEDVATLAPMLPNVILNHRVDYTQFSHADFIVARDIVPLLYSYVMDTLKKVAP